MRRFHFIIFKACQTARLEKKEHCLTLTISPTVNLDPMGCSLLRLQIAVSSIFGVLRADRSGWYRVVAAKGPGLGFQ